MRAELEILFRNGYLSRKSYRDFLADPPPNIDELQKRLFEKQLIDPPDWSEALPLLAEPEGLESGGEPPESQNATMHAIQDRARKIAANDTTVLLLGESGVGKSRLARYMHHHSHRRQGPMVTVACGSIPDTLLESELFGVEKGAYTGANASREGRFRRAHRGTIFLDEIGELTASLQVKLLRVLQERRVEPLGSAAEVEVDVRLIAATNRDLEADVRSGRFREDLFYRLNVVPLELPPLRDRREDILPLTKFFVERFSRQRGLAYDASDARLQALLVEYDWPGNIRELENCLERLAVLSRDGRLNADDLPPRILRDIRPTSTGSKPDPRSEAFPSLRELERDHIVRALTSSKGNVQKAARMLEIHRNTLSRKLDEFGIDSGAFKKSRRPGRRSATAGAVPETG
ncbi:MAG: sigma-54-dependent Fis family transcriptional regulator [Spirochaetales bacterium]|nr:sigma-54-dependent Fis family transcriptional regulator [Leptospiraceae bacterium]MCP5480635.1 sigma-54-dependent Fis family transcriptional regulator [Spirochaetales bacterium]MCP5483987.1 sigma-54-dependent Fis family transcriptional regulator [Spirochaetales bacterium]